MGRVGGDGGDGVAAIERLFAGHDIPAVETVVDGSALFLVLDFRGDFWEFGRRHDGMDAGQGKGAAGVYAPDAGMGVGAAQDLAVEHPGRWMSAA